MWIEIELHEHNSSLGRVQVLRIQMFGETQVLSGAVSNLGLQMDFGLRLGPIFKALGSLTTHMLTIISLTF